MVGIVCRVETSRSSEISAAGPQRSGRRSPDMLAEIEDPLCEKCQLMRGKR